MKTTTPEQFENAVIKQLERIEPEPQVLIHIKKCTGQTSFTYIVSFFPTTPKGLIITPKLRPMVGTNPTQLLKLIDNVITTELKALEPCTVQ